MPKKPFFPRDPEPVAQWEETVIARGHCALPQSGPTVRQGAVLQEILEELESPDAGTRAAAVRRLCPCRTAWDIPVQRYIAAMQEDPSSSVRHEVQHVLTEDSKWGKKLAGRRLKTDGGTVDEDGVTPGPDSLAWRRRARPFTKGAAARLAWSPRGRR